MKTGIKLFLALSTTLLAAPSFAVTLTEGVPQFDHQFVILMENHSYDQIIDSPYTPYINQLANTYNLATNYFGTTHPSLPNYIATIAGSDFGNGAAFDLNGFPDPNGGNDNSPCFSAGTPGASAVCDPTINSPSIVDQLKTAGLTWKTYQENLPAVGSNYASSVNKGIADKLYAVKHNPFMYFASVQNDPAELNNVVPETQLVTDLANGTVPNFSFIAPNQCHDMHGDPSGGCASGDSGAVDVNEQKLLKAGDDYVKSLINQIQTSSTWSQGNNVIYLLWDENDYGKESNKVPLISITNNGSKGVRDNTPYNHYSLLRTIEDGFKITEHLNNAKDAQPMTPLVAQSVPEPSSSTGLWVFCAMGTGLLLKRKLAQSATSTEIQRRCKNSTD